MASFEPHSVPSVCETTVFRGAAAPEDATPDLLIEVPHGATRAAHFDALRAELRGPFDDSLRDYFFVNTDVGAPETALETARRFVERAPAKSALVIRCLVPRTFIDCNRIVDATTRPSSSAAGQMTPGVTSYVTDAKDLWLLLGRHAEYVTEAGRAMVGVFAPPNRLAEFFGLWTFATSLASIVGPLTYGLVTWLIAGNHRLAIVSTAVFFVVGWLAIRPINVERGAGAAARAAA